MQCTIAVKDCTWILIELWQTFAIILFHRCIVFLPIGLSFSSGSCFIASLRTDWVLTKVPRRKKAGTSCRASHHGHRSGMRSNENMRLTLCYQVILQCLPLKMLQMLLAAIRFEVKFFSCITTIWIGASWNISYGYSGNHAKRYFEEHDKTLSVANKFYISFQGSQLHSVPLQRKQGPCQQFQLEVSPSSQDKNTEMIKSFFLVFLDLDACVFHASKLWYKNGKILRLMGAWGTPETFIKDENCSTSF